MHTHPYICRGGNLRTYYKPPIPTTAGVFFEIRHEMVPIGYQVGVGCSSKKKNYVV